MQHKPEAILAAALRCSAKEGVHVSTARIASAAGVSNGSLFNYFPVDLPVPHLATLIQHHLDQAVTSELDDRQAELAFHVLWNGITQKTPPSRSIRP